MSNLVSTWGIDMIYITVPFHMILENEKFCNDHGIDEKCIDKTDSRRMNIHIKLTHDEAVKYNFIKG